MNFIGFDEQRTENKRWSYGIWFTKSASIKNIKQSGSFFNGDASSYIISLSSSRVKLTQNRIETDIKTLITPDSTITFYASTQILNLVINHFDKIKMSAKYCSSVLIILWWDGIKYPAYKNSRSKNCYHLSIQSHVEWVTASQKNSPHHSRSYDACRKFSQHLFRDTIANYEAKNWTLYKLW